MVPQSATETEDYTTKNVVQELALQCGTMHYIDISVTDDAVSEPDEAFVLEIDGADVGVGSRIIFVIIVDDDRKQQP